MTGQMTDIYSRLIESKEILDQWKEMFRDRLPSAIGHNGSDHTKA